MNLRSPSELYLLHLLVHPDGHSINDVIEAAIDKRLVFVGRTYLERLRDAHVPPQPFRPLDRAHKPSQKYLLERGLYDLFHPDEATRQMLEIIDLPSVRSYVETLRIACVDARTIRDGIRTRFVKNYYTQAISKYFACIYNIDYFDPRTLMTLLDLEVDQVRESKNEEVRRLHKLARKNARHDPRRLAVQLPGGRVAAQALMERFGDWPQIDNRKTVEDIESMALTKAAMGVAIGNSNDIRRAESLMKIASLAHELRQTLIDPGQELASQFKTFVIKHDAMEMKTRAELDGDVTFDLNPQEGDRPEEEEERPEGEVA